MKLTRSQKKAKLQAAAEALIEELLDWDEQNQAPNLTQIEDEVLALRHRFGQEMAATMVVSQAARQLVEAPACPACGQPMRYKGQKQKDIESRVGEMEIERGYYYCKDCQNGLFPLDTQLELHGGPWSEGLRRDAVWLSGVAASYELAGEVLQRIGHMPMSCTSIWRCTQVVGEQFQRVEQTMRERALMLDVAVTPTQDAITQESVETAHAIHNSYVAHLGAGDVVGEMTWTEARRRGWEQAQDTQVIGDGAVWIWNEAALHFPTSHQLVDWYHAKQHLIEAARLLKPENTPAFSRWLNSRTTLLYQGQAARIAHELDKAAAAQGSEALSGAATYFHHNHLRMNYLEMREEHWPIGSGMVESGAKQFKLRFAGPGMRWSRQGAENLLPIRSAILSHRFNELWTAAKSMPLH